MGVVTSWWDMVASMVRLPTALENYISDWPRFSRAKLSLTAIGPARSLNRPRLHPLHRNSRVGTVESLTRISRLQEQNSRPHIYRQHCLPQKGLLRTWLRVWPLRHRKPYYAGWIWKWTWDWKLPGWRLWPGHGISKKKVGLGRV